ncbi:uncharacterized protein [Diadema antillarum]|uniref:uncharacterized protein n=1 Tax=Diadema antillarum TaxID=105358 RepID=UPI003A852A58
MTPTTLSTTVTTPFTIPMWFESFNPLSGFDEPPPVLLRGDDGLNATSGIFHIVDDGFYVFMIHRGGVNGDNSSVDLVLLDDHDLSNTTLATVEDNGEGTVFSAHVAVELRRDDYLLIANPTYSDVEGDMDNPFIYNAFLLYHKPLSSFPRVRQSAFTVTVAGNLTLADEPLTNYNSPVVDINGDFNIDSGTFVVPMRGIYIFHLDVTFVSPSLDVRAALAITVNDAIRARVQARFESPQLRKNAAVTIAQSLQQGNSVQLLNLLSTPDIDCNVVLTGYLLS